MSDMKKSVRDVIMPIDAKIGTILGIRHSSTLAAMPESEISFKASPSIVTISGKQTEAIVTLKVVVQDTRIPDQAVRIKA